MYPRSISASPPPPPSILRSVIPILPPIGQVYTTSGTYTAIIPNSHVCDSIITINFTVNFPPFLFGVISGNSAICAGSSNTYTVTAVPSATIYNWTLPNGWSGSSTTNTISTTATATGGIITVTAENNCGVSLVRTLNVAINPIPAQPGSITGNIAVCPGSTKYLQHRFSTRGDKLLLDIAWAGGREAAPPPASARMRIQQAAISP